MKKNSFVAIFLFSIFLTILGFILDSNEFVLDLNSI